MRAEKGSVSQSLNTEDRSVWEEGPNPKNTQSTEQFILVKSGGSQLSLYNPLEVKWPFHRSHMSDILSIRYPEYESQQQQNCSYELATG